MRDPDRISEVLRALERAWRAQPDARLGQLLYGAAGAAGWSSDDIFYVEDSTILDGLRVMGGRAHD